MAAYFSGLSKHDQVLFLLNAAFELTLGARGSYRGVDLPAGATTKLAAFNEVQHQALSMARHVLAGSQARYPDETFFEILLEKASVGGCEGELVSALESAKSDLQRAKSQASDNDS